MSESETSRLAELCDATARKNECHENYDFYSLAILFNSQKRDYPTQKTDKAVAYVRSCFEAVYKTIIKIRDSRRMITQAVSEDNSQMEDVAIRSATASFSEYLRFLMLVKDSCDVETLNYWSENTVVTCYQCAGKSALTAILAFIDRFSHILTTLNIGLSPENVFNSVFQDFETSIDEKDWPAWKIEQEGQRVLVLMDNEFKVYRNLNINQVGSSKKTNGIPDQADGKPDDLITIAIAASRYEIGSDRLRKRIKKGDFKSHQAPEKREILVSEAEIAQKIRRRAK